MVMACQLEILSGARWPDALPGSLQAAFHTLPVFIILRSLMVRAFWKAMIPVMVRPWPNTIYQYQIWCRLPVAHSPPTAMFIQ